MSVEAALSAGRSAALARMTSTATVRRKSGTASVVGGFEVPGWTDVHTALPCRLAGESSTTWQTAGTPVEVGRRVLHVPHDTTDLLDGDHVEITSGDSAGLVLRVVEVTWQDQATARRLPVVTVPRPEEWA